MKSFVKAVMCLCAVASADNAGRASEAGDDSAYLQMIMRRHVKRQAGNNLFPANTPPPTPAGPDLERWRKSTLYFLKDQVAGVPDSVVDQLQTNTIIPYPSDLQRSTAADLVSQAVLVDACDPSTPAALGIGPDGKYTDRICGLIESWVDFWSLDPANYTSRLAIVLNKVNEASLQDVNLVQAVTGLPLQNIQQLQGAVSLLPGGFSNPLLTSTFAGFGVYHQDGKILGTYQDAVTRNSLYAELPVCQLSIGDGYFAYIDDYLGEVDNGEAEIILLFNLGVQLASAIRPLPIVDTSQPSNETERELQFEALFPSMQLLRGYFLGHKKSVLPLDKDKCKWLRKIREDIGPIATCTTIVGMDMAAEDGDIVNASRVVDFGFDEENLKLMSRFDEAICQTPPECDEIEPVYRQDIY